LRSKYQALVALVAVLVLAAVVGGQAIARGHAAVTVQLLAINDFHGNLEPPSGSSGAINGVAAGGSEYLATHLVNDIHQNPNSLVVGAGDLIGASPLLSGLFHDEPTVEAMNAMKLSVTSVGNHEFDEGWTELLRIQNGGCTGPDSANKCKGGQFTGAKYNYLSANVLKVPTKPEIAAVAKKNAAARKAFAKQHATPTARRRRTARPRRAVSRTSSA